MSVYQELLRQGQGATERFVDVERRDDSAIVTLNEPERLNVLSAPLVVQTKAALMELAADPAIRTVVLTGGGRGFSAGGDLKMMRLAQDHLADAEGSTDIWRWIRYEFGGIARLAWALTCDVVLASDDALIVPAFGRLGLLPEVGTSWALTRRLGYQGAFAFFAGGLPIDARRALELGLVQEVVAPTDLMAAADRWCQRIAALAPHALAMAKPLLRQAADASWDTTITMEEFAEPNCFTTAAFQETVRSMTEAG
jgi:2-(1,2-epoxy-1,2-dihydrophenyl)acetyl-CoA isomerase